MGNGGMDPYDKSLKVPYSSQSVRLRVLGASSGLRARV